MTTASSSVGIPEPMNWHPSFPTSPVGMIKSWESPTQKEIDTNKMDDDGETMAENPSKKKKTNDGKKSNQSTKKSKRAEPVKFHSERTRMIIERNRPKQLVPGKPLSDELSALFDECAILALKDLSIQDGDSCGLRFVKIENAKITNTYGYDLYSITFQAETAKYGLATYQAALSDSIVMREVMHVRIIKPFTTKWYTGKLRVPLV